MEGKALFEKITTDYSTKYPDVQPGKMMSSQAIKVKDKVFAFFSKNGDMVFRLGKDFDPDTSESKGIHVFNPFKNKGSLSGWFVVPEQEKRLWESYTHQALENTRKLN
ncbi:hypothetical protein [Flexithrix dorotheae]|uniref:hypothetical protein n=1 Tax=Flexithrix dorotheae TaxID=70993 RepID=UPI00037BB50B|nr:hypothetical protein [Flexithrix dorotheae]